MNRLHTVRDRIPSADLPSFRLLEIWRQYLSNASFEELLAVSMCRLGYGQINSWTTPMEPPWLIPVRPQKLWIGEDAS